MEELRSSTAEWETFHQQVRRRVTPAAWQTWIEPLSSSIEAGSLRLVAPTDFHYRWVGDRYLPALEEAALDTLGLEVELTKAEDQLQTLEEQRNALSSRIASLLGRTPDLDAPLPFPTLGSKVPQIGSTDSLESAVKGHPLVAAASSGVITADLAEQLSRKSPLPDINIGANVIDIGNSGDTAVGIMVGVSIPLQFDKYRAEKIEKSALASAARADVESIRQKLLADLHRTIQAWREADKRLQLYREKLLPSAEQALEVTSESYRNDKASVTDLIDSERTLLDLRLMYQRALSSAHKAALEIRTLTEPLSISNK